MTETTWQSRLKPPFSGVIATLSRHASWLLPATMIWFAVEYIAIPALLPLALGGYRHSPWLYTAGQAGLSYFNTGFARRELQGTILALVSGEPLFNMIMMHVVFYVILSAVLIWLVCRRSPSLQRVALAIPCVALLSRVGADVGRIDMAIMVCALPALWAVRSGRWTIAALCLAVALAFHETGYIFLGPWLMVAAFEQNSWRNWRSSSALGGILVVLASLAAYGVAYATHPDVQQVARQIHSKFLDPRDADLALYFNLNGFKNITTALCETHMDPNFPINVLSGLVLLSGAALILRPKRWRLTLAAILPPYLFLCLIAIDVGRWSMFGMFLILSLALTDPDQPETFNLGCFLGALALFLAITSFMGRRDVFTPIPAVDFVAQRVNYQTLAPIPAMYECDPDWIRFLGLAK